MIFASTKNNEIKATFGEAIFKGLADDGALFHPVETPNLKNLYDSFSSKDSFNSIAAQITANLLKDEISEGDAKSICENAFTFEPQLKKIEENHFVLELFHGPSAAFKDFGASFLASSMSNFLKNNFKRAVILTATSGDTGSAVARAFFEKENIDVVILYPSKRVSPLQEKQLTTLGKNIHALEVNGSFDDCQRLVKEAFTNIELKNKYNLTSANSINLGRLIPQSFYYTWAWSRLKENLKNDEICFCVPSGNFGNLTAGVLAKKWGMDCGHFIAATNRNNVVPIFLETGIYTPKASVQTPSNAMDVGAPSNFERLKAIFSDNKKMAKEITGYYFSDEETLAQIKKYYQLHNYLICPHTAVGTLATEKFLASDKGGNTVVTLSTAHPAKFLEIVEASTGVLPPLPECLSSLKSKEKIATLMQPTLSDLTDKLKKFFG